MSAEHTPGPWLFMPAGEAYVGSGCHVKAPTPEGPGWPTPSATGFYVMACPPPHGKDRLAEQEANARLIAAAPELLAALERLVTAIGYVDGLPGPKGHTILSAAHTAIAKARGEAA